MRQAAERLAPPGGELPPVRTLEKLKMTLVERVAEWPKQWLREGIEQGIARGRAQGIAQGRDEERALLCRQAARKFDATAGENLAAALAGVADAERLGRVGDWIIECATASELLAHVRDDGRAGG